MNNKNMQYYKTLKGNYIFNKKSLKATLKNGRQGIVTLFDCNSDYINILFEEEKRIEAIPFEDIKIIEIIYNLI